MSENFGARLRRHRECQAVALATIAEQTKIKLSLLEALERDDVAHWPSGIFRRAFIRAYAHAIGLDPDVVVREFLEVHPEPSDVAAAAQAAADAAERARNNGSPPTRLRNLFDSAIGSIARRRSGSTGDSPVADVTLDQQPAPAAPALEPVAVAAETLITPAAASIAATLPVASQRDLMAVANLCTRFGRVEKTPEVQPLLREAARILDATGLIVWIWDPLAAQLRPALVHGYSDTVIAQLPAVRRDADNATAAAFRSNEVRAIDGGDHASGALVVPLLTPGGCAGVLAIELRCESQPTTEVHAVAIILAALLAQLIGDRVAEAAIASEIIDTPIGRFAGRFDRATAGISA
jgi:GAF domain-containing protein